MPWPRVLTSWLTDIRRAALIASIAAVLGVLVPAWDGARMALSIESIGFWRAPWIVLTSCFAAIVPVFYFALYRSEGLPHFPKSLRVISLTAAIILGIITGVGLPRWIESFGAYWADIRLLDWTAGAVTVLDAAHEPGTSTQVADLLGIFANLAYMMLLIAFFRQDNESSGDMPTSRMLAITTKIAVIVWGLFVAGCLVRLLFMPYVYAQTRDLAIQVGRTPPGLGRMTLDAVRMLLGQACLFAAPYAVYRSRVRPALAVEPTMSTP